MSEFQAYEFTDIGSVLAWAAEPLLRRVRGHYGAAAYWRRVYGSSGLPARAARAAEHQGPRVTDAVIARLRESTFVDRHPVDGHERLHEVLRDIAELDRWRLVRDLDSPDVLWSVAADESLARRRGCPFPTVLFRGPGGDRVVTGAQAFEAYVAAIEAVAPALGRVAEAA